MRWKFILSQTLIWALVASALTLAGAFSTHLFITEPIFPGEFVGWFTFGAVWMLLLWGAGWIAVIRIRYSLDAQLFYVSPLTPSLFHRRGVGRVLIAVVMIFAVTPLLIVYALCWVDGLEEELPAFWPFLLNFVLTWILAVLVPLSEAMSGRSWSKAFFFLRTLVKWLLRFLKASVARLSKPFGKYSGLAAFGLTVLLVIFAWRYRGFLLSLCEYALAELAGGNAAMRFIYYMLVPIPGFFHIHSPDVPVVAQWVLTAFLSILLAGCLRSIAKHWHTVPRHFDEDWSVYWEKFGPEIEEDELSYRDEEDIQRSVFANIEGDDAFPDVLESDSAAQQGPGLEYAPTLQPEKQHFRHSQFWRGDWTEQRPLLIHSFWFWIVLIGWLSYFLICVIAKDNVDDFEGSMLLLSIVSPIIIWIAYWARANLYLYNLKSASNLPARWPELIRVDMGPSLRNTLLADCLAALLLTVVSAPSLFFFVPFLGAILALRASFLLGRWIKSHSEAGRTLPHGLYGIAWGLVLIVAFSTCGMALTDLLSDDSLAWRTTAGPYALVLSGLPVFVFVVALLCVAAIRGTVGS